MEKKRNALKDEAWEISTILFEVQESLKIVEYLIKDDPKIDVYQKHLNFFWRFTTSIYVDHILLKISILFNPEETYSINKLLNKLKGGGEFSRLISDSTIHEWETEIEKLKSVTEKIKLTRDKRIAHKDRKDYTEPDILISELKEIVLFVQKIVREIYLKVTGAAFMVNDPIGSPVESLKVVLKALNEQRRQDMRPLFDEAKKHGLQEELPESEKQ